MRAEAEPGRSDARANRGRILAAAREVIGREGDRAEIREIADRAGVGLATIYRAFGNKDGLLRALAEQTARDFAGLLAEAETAADRRQGLRSFIVNAVAFVETRGALFSILGGYSAGHREEALQSLSSRLRTLLEEGKAAGEFAGEANTAVVAHLVLASLVSLAHARQHLPQVNAEELADAVLRLLTERKQD